MKLPGTAATSFMRKFFSHRIDSRILVLFLASSGGGFALLKLASEVLEGDTFALDHTILRILSTAVGFQASVAE